MRATMRHFGDGDFCFQADEAWARFPANGPEGEAVAVACDSRDRVYVFLRGPRPVQIFEPDGTPIDAWGGGQFVRPHGVTIDHQDRLYLTDDYDHTVRVFSPERKPLLTLGKSGSPSDTGATSTDYRTILRVGPPFHYPTNVAVTSSGEIFVADGYGNARIHRFSVDGELLASWGEPGGGPGQFCVPHGIAIGSDGTIYVADRENTRIQLFTPKGHYLAEWIDVARPCHIAFDAAGNAYVAELGHRAGRFPGTGEAEPGATGGRVSIFTAQGKLLARWGGGDDPCALGDFYAPHGICVDSRGSVYVTEVAWNAGGKAGRVPGHCRTLQKFVRVK
jgi:DNA-binding beta-propeller fold protein YncE